MSNKMSINPVEYISQSLALKGYGENVAHSHIKYNKDINENYDYQIIRSTSHDGTLIFTKILIEEALDLLVTKRSYFKKTITEDKLKQLKDIEYTVGDMAVESKFGKVNVEIGEIDGQTDTISLPVRCRYIFN